MDHNAAVEQRIKDAGCNAPRLTPADIERVIVATTFTTMPSGKSMVCEITLANGFTVRGESAVVKKENFREDIGREISYKRAHDKIWELEGYLLQERCWRAEQGVVDPDR